MKLSGRADAPESRCEESRVIDSGDVRWKSSPRRPRICHPSSVLAYGLRPGRDEAHPHSVASDHHALPAGRLDIRDAMKRTTAYVNAQPTESNVTRLRPAASTGSGR